MSIQHGVIASVGFAVEVVLTIIEKGEASLDAMINGMLAALGALIAKELYELVKRKIKTRKQNGKRKIE